MARQRRPPAGMRVRAGAPSRHQFLSQSQALDWALAWAGPDVAPAEAWLASACASGRIVARYGVLIDVKSGRQYRRDTEGKLIPAALWARPSWGVRFEEDHIVFVAGDGSAELAAYGVEFLARAVKKRAQVSGAQVRNVRDFAAECQVSSPTTKA
jgi:hypothetical protein